MRAAVWLLVIGFFHTLYGQEGSSSPPPAPAHVCSIGSPPEFEKAPQELQPKLDALRHRAVYACAHSRRMGWAERIVFPEAKTTADCDVARHREEWPELPALQPLKIEDAGYVSDPSPQVEVLFRLPSGRQVKISFGPTEEAWQADDPLATLVANGSGLYLDPYNSPFTPAEVESIQNKDFPVGTRSEVLRCAGAHDWTEGPPHDWRKPHWLVLDGKGYRFDNEGRVAEIRNVANLKQ